MTAPAPVRPPKKRAPTLYAIVGFKLLKGVITLLLGFGVYSLTDNNLPADFQKLLAFFHLDPEKKFFVDLAVRIATITPKNLEWVAGVSVFYGTFLLIQATGLIFRLRWAVWLVIGESGFFIPIEVLELIHHPSWILFFVLAVNVFIVWYLFANRNRIIKHHQS